MAEGAGKALHVVLDVPPDFPTSYVSNLVISHTEHDFTLTFFDIRPPILFGPPDEKAKQLEAMEKVVAVPRARIIIAASRMHEFVHVMQDNLKTYNDAMSSKEESPE